MTAEEASLDIPHALLDPPANDHIQVAVQDSVVFKAYYPIASHKAQDKFDRELSAFEFFTQNNAFFVPQLFESGRMPNVCWLAMSHAGITLSKWLETAPTTALEPIFDQLLQIDAWLYQNNVNYLEGSPKDMLVDKDGKVRLIDFEYTFLDEPFEQILLERVNHDRLSAVPAERASLVRNIVRARKHQSRAFLRRKIRSAILRRCGLNRVQKSIRAE